MGWIFASLYIHVETLPDIDCDRFPGSGIPTVPAFFSTLIIFRHCIEPSVAEFRPVFEIAFDLALV